MQAPSAKNNPGSQVSSAKKLPWRSLTWQTFFITILPLTLVVLVVAFGSLSVHQNAMRSLVAERDERAVRTAAAALEEQIKHRVLAVRNLALLAGRAEQAELAEILASSVYLLEEFDGGVAFFNPQGAMERASGASAVWDAPAGQIADLVQSLFAVQATGGFSITSLTLPGSSETTIVILAAAPDGSRAAAGAFSAAGMIEHTLAGAYEQNSEASIRVLDAGGHIIYLSNEAMHTSEIASHPGIGEALLGKSGTTYFQEGGSEYVAAYSPVASMGWALVLEEPWNMVESPTLRLSQLAPLVLVPVLILAVIALAFGARQIVDPLRALASSAATLAWGDFISIEKPVGGIEEIRQLQHELSQMARQVQSAQQGLHDYIGAITAAQEDERRRLARELHDDTIQALIALKQRVQLTQMAAARGKSEATALQEITELTGQTIENLRRLIHALRPIYLEDLGLVTALEMLANETAQALKIAVDFTRQGAEIRLASEVELSLYRMAQEACSNIARHAQASQAFLQVDFAPEIAHDPGERQRQGVYCAQGPGGVRPKRPFRAAGSS